MIEIDIQVLWDMNLDTYVDWVLGVEDKAYKPTKNTIAGFPIWRKMSYDQWMRTFEVWKIGNSHPPAAIAGKLIRYICDEMGPKECILLACINDGLFTNEHYRLARLIGKLAFLKWLHETHLSVHQEPSAAGRHSFEDFLNDAGKEKLPQIEKQYKDAKPRIIALLLWAMNDLKFFSYSPDNINQKHLHDALVQSFGKIGTRQSLNKNLPLMKTKTDEIEMIKNNICG